MAASTATQEAMWQARLLEQMDMRINLPIKNFFPRRKFLQNFNHAAIHHFRINFSHFCLFLHY